MAKLRVDKIASVGVSTETTGSVYFNGDGTDNRYDSLSIANNTDFNFPGDFTIECWVYSIKALDSYSVEFAHIAGKGNGIVASTYALGIYQSKINFTTSDSGGTYTVRQGASTLTNNTWYHFAVTRQSNTLRLFVNGKEDYSATVSDDLTNTKSFNIGDREVGDVNSNYPLNGYISNLRVCKGHAVYTSNFAPPTRELEVHQGPEDDRTVLLCCYDGENIFADKSGRHVIAAYGDRTSSPTPTATDRPVGITTFQPGLDRDVDNTFGPVFQGGAGYASQNWLTLPKGTTTERMPVLGGIDASNARGVFAGGYSTSNINYIQISTLGDSSDFGERSVANFARPASVSSSTRGLFAGGFVSPAYSNTIDYITISSTGDAKDFGDMSIAMWARAGCSNSIRGILAGGYAAPLNYNVIDHLTIATTGNTQDFGDLTRSRREMGGSSSTTRGIFMGGRSPVPSGVNNDEDIIDYITIASTGNAVDFGNLAAARTAGASCSNAIRSLYSGGNSSNSIEFVTIATLGDAVDFGDMNNALNRLGSCASSTRGIIAGGSGPNNTIEYVTIATAGDAQDFGDLSRVGKRDIAGLSNGHGGLG